MCKWRLFCSRSPGGGQAGRDDGPSPATHSTCSARSAIFSDVDPPCAKNADASLAGALFSVAPNRNCTLREAAARLKSVSRFSGRQVSDPGAPARRGVPVCARDVPPPRGTHRAAGGAPGVCRGTGRGVAHAAAVPETPDTLEGRRQRGTAPVAVAGVPRRNGGMVRV